MSLPAFFEEEIRKAPPAHENYTWLEKIKYYYGLDFKEMKISLLVVVIIVLSHISISPSEMYWQSQHDGNGKSRRFIVNIFS